MIQPNAILNNLRAAQASFPFVNLVMSFGTSWDVIWDSQVWGTAQLRYFYQYNVKAQFQFRGFINLQL